MKFLRCCCCGFARCSFPLFFHQSRIRVGLMCAAQPSNSGKWSTLIVWWNVWFTRDRRVTKECVCAYSEKRPATYLYRCCRLLPSADADAAVNAGEWWWCCCCADYRSWNFVYLWKYWTLYHSIGMHCKLIFNFDIKTIHSNCWMLRRIVRTSDAVSVGFIGGKWLYIISQNGIGFRCALFYSGICLFCNKRGILN